MHRVRWLVHLHHAALYTASLTAPYAGWSLCITHQAGYCKANAHFFGIWSVYAVERPDVIDPAMGTEQDLKDLYVFGMVLVECGAYMMV